MPALAGTKRVKGVSIYRPFVFGSIATPLPTDPSKRPSNAAPDHTHQWTVYIRGVDGADITYWLKKAQFKLHETYSQSLRTIESPAPLEVTETGWGEFEITIKMWFVDQSSEKAVSIYHNLKLHPYGEDKDAAKARGDSVISQNYEEIVFNEPTEAFYEVLTSGAPPPGSRGKGAGKAAKMKKGGERTAEIPAVEGDGNPYSARAEGRELDRLKEAYKQVDALTVEEKRLLAEREKELEELRKGEGAATKGK